MIKRACACGKQWEGDGACPQCSILNVAKIASLEEKLEHLRTGFASLIKIAAETPTAAKKPDGIGPLMSAAWRIRQLGKERLEALEKIRELAWEIRKTIEWLEPQGPGGRKVAEILREKVRGELAGGLTFREKAIAWLGRWRDHLPAEAVSALQDLAGVPDAEREEEPGPWTCEQCGKEIPADKGIGGGYLSEGRVCSSECYDRYVESDGEGEPENAKH